MNLLGVISIGRIIMGANKKKWFERSKKEECVIKELEFICIAEI